MRILLMTEFAPCHPDDQNGVWRTPSGKALVLSHGSVDGQLEEWAETFLETNPDSYVVCCYPRAAQAAHPQALVIGDWDGTTTAYVDQLVSAVHIVRGGRYVTLYEGACVLSVESREP
jgi:hypothetical protein